MKYQKQIKNVIKRSSVALVALLGFGLVQPSFGLDNPSTPSPSSNSSASATTIDDVLISDTANDQGYVLKNKGEPIPANAEKIYVTVQLGHAVQGLKVIATLNYPGNKDDIGPVVATVDMTGDTMEAFSFRTNPMPWPTGDYSVDISIGDNISKTVHFTVK